QRPVDVVAEVSGTKQRLLAILPVVHRRALGRRQASLVHVAGAPQARDGPPALIARTFDKRTLGEEDVVRDVEREKIIADVRHHHIDGMIADERQPLRLRLVLQARAIAGGELRSHRLEVVAGIEAFRYGGDVLAERLAGAQERRARERVDLRAGIVDGGFARDLEGAKGAQIGGPEPGRRQGPTGSGPVGLAETYSTLTAAPWPTLLRP